MKILWYISMAADLFSLPLNTSRSDRDILHFGLSATTDTPGIVEKVIGDGGNGIRNYPFVQYFLGAIYALIMLTSLLGNLAVVLAVMIFHQLKSLNHYLLMSLAAADLTVTVRRLPTVLWNLKWKILAENIKFLKLFGFLNLQWNLKTKHEHLKK